MRKCLLATLSIAALGLASQAVLAADVEMAPAAYDWSGPYIGVTAGYAWGNHTQSESGADSGKQDMEGFVAGGTLGYNMQMDSFLIGLETDISYSDIDGTFEDQLGWGCGGAPDGCFTEIGWFGTARVRLGLPMDSFLPYVTGGLAFGGVESGFVVDPSQDVDETAFGWTVGAGLEAAVSQNITAKAEVLYVDFGKADSSSIEVDTDFITARLGLNFQF